MLVTLPFYTLQVLHGNQSQAGLITTVFLIAYIFTRPFAGKWSERVGKYIIFICSFIIIFVASILYFVPHSIMGLLLLRFFHGIGFGMATTSTGAIVADIILEPRKGEGMGYYGLTLNLAMVVGPFLGLTVMQYAGTDGMFLIDALCALLALIAGLFVRISKVITHGLAAHSRKRSGIQEFLETTAIPISLVSAFFALVYSVIVSFVAIYAKELGLVDVAGYFFVVYAAILLITRPFSGKWFDLASWESTFKSPTAEVMKLRYLTATSF